MRGGEPDVFIHVKYSHTAPINARCGGQSREEFVLRWGTGNDNARLPLGLQSLAKDVGGLFCRCDTHRSAIGMHEDMEFVDGEVEWIHGLFFSWLSGREW
jgi:hypothetical protein